MNTNGLARHYESLTPWERLPLIAAASARGGELERERLKRSAPTRTYRLPDYYGPADALRGLACLVRMGMLDLAAYFHRTVALLEAFEGRGGWKRAKRFRTTVGRFAYLVVVWADARARVGAGLSIDPTRPEAGLPVGATVAGASPRPG